MRVIFFGMEGGFSTAPLAALLAAGHQVCAVVVPPPPGVVPAEPVRRLAPPRRSALPLHAAPSEQTVVGLAWAQDLTVLEAGELSHARTLALLGGLDADVICVACFPRLLPPAVLRLARHGGLNVHPSLLPAYRGPYPLFWVFHGYTSFAAGSCIGPAQQNAGAQPPKGNTPPAQSMRDMGGAGAAPPREIIPFSANADAPAITAPWRPNEGLGNAGVTIHLLDERADSGAIAAQAPLALPDGIGYGAAERICAREGARLLVGTLDALAAGRLRPAPQPRVAVPTAPVPSAADFVITPAWSARRAFNFIRGLAEWGQPLAIEIGGDRLTVQEAVSFDEGATMGEPLWCAGRHLRIRCSPGVLDVTVS